MQVGITSRIAIESLELQLLGATEVRLSGTISTTSAQNELARHLVQIHEGIVAKKYPSFTVDVRGLNFVNSSAIRVFVNWISLADQARYKLVFLTDHSITWHRLSFSVLKSLAPGTVDIKDGRSIAGGSQ
jgi:hypothetical protein